MSDLPDFLKSGEAARLIPTVADTSKEGRAVSILLASMMAVRPLATALLSSIGQRLGKRTEVRCYREVVFKNSAKVDRPDGLIVCGGSKKEWSALVEGKIGSAKIDGGQIQKYADIAKANDLSALLTISNELAALPTHGPVQLSGAMARHVDVFHWSWISVLTQAQLVFANAEFEDEHEHFILSELIRFLSHSSTGVSSYDMMAPAWKELAVKIQAGAPITKDSELVKDAVASWHQEEKDLCLLLSRELAKPVQIRMVRAHREKPIDRLAHDAQHLCNSYRLETIFETPNTAAPIQVECDFRRRSIVCSMKLKAPEDKKRNSAKINWLLRQLTHTSDERIFIRAIWPRRTRDTFERLVDVRENLSLLEAGREDLSIVSFEVTMVENLAGRFSSRRKFVQIAESFVPSFYRDVGEHLRAWIPKPPKMRDRKIATNDDPEQASESESASNVDDDATPDATDADQKSERSVFVSETPWHWLSRKV